METSYFILGNAALSSEFIKIRLEAIFDDSELLTNLDGCQYPKTAMGRGHCCEPPKILSHACLSCKNKAKSFGSI